MNERVIPESKRVFQSYKKMSLLDEINGSGNTDVHSFITSLECSAKRIMRDANRKAKKAARDAEVFENKSKRKKTHQ